MSVATLTVKALRAPAKLARRNTAFRIALVAVTLTAVVVLVVLITDLILDGRSMLEMRLFLRYPGSNPQAIGARSAIVGTVWLMALAAAFTVPIGIGAALYLEEFAPRNRITRAIETNTANLAGVPSVIYGLLGLAAFARALQLGAVTLAGALTLTLLVLPIVIIASREALRAIPMGIREGAFALGATRWEVVRYQVLPAAVPGMMTGTILALSRAIGEAAPLLALGGILYYGFDPTPFSPFAALPLQILGWIFRPQADFHRLAAAASLILLALLLSMNAFAIWLRNRYRREW